jgi:hypothetical protein
MVPRMQLLMKEQLWVAETATKRLTTKLKLKQPQPRRLWSEAMHWFLRPALPLSRRRMKMMMTMQTGLWQASSNWSEPWRKRWRLMKQTVSLPPEH